MSVSTFVELKYHVGHNIECVAYGDDLGVVNVAVECEECGMVLFDFDADEE